MTPSWRIPIRLSSPTSTKRLPIGSHRSNQTPNLNTPATQQKTVPSEHLSPQMGGDNNPSVYFPQAASDQNTPEIPHITEPALNNNGIGTVSTEKKENDKSHIPICRVRSNSAPDNKHEVVESTFSQAPAKKIGETDSKPPVNTFNLTAATTIKTNRRQPIDDNTKKIFSAFRAYSDKLSPGVTDEENFRIAIATHADMALQNIFTEFTELINTHASKSLAEFLLKFSHFKKTIDLLNETETEKFFVLIKGIEIDKSLTGKIFYQTFLTISERISELENNDQQLFFKFIKLYKIANDFIIHDFDRMFSLFLKFKEDKKTIISIAKTLLNDDKDIKELIYKYFVSVDNDTSYTSLNNLYILLKTDLAINHTELLQQELNYPKLNLHDNIANEMCEIIKNEYSSYLPRFKVIEHNPGTHKRNYTIEGSEIGLVRCLYPEKAFEKESFSAEIKKQNDIIKRAVLNKRLAQNTNLLYEIDNIITDDRIDPQSREALHKFIKTKFYTDEVRYYVNADGKGNTYKMLMNWAQQFMSTPEIKSTLDSESRLKEAIKIITAYFDLIRTLFEARIGHEDLHAENILYDQEYFKAIDFGKFEICDVDEKDIKVVSQTLLGLVEYFTGGNILKYAQQLLITPEDKKKCRRMVIALAFAIVMDSYEEGFKKFNSVEFRLQLNEITKELMGATTMDEIMEIPTKFEQLCIKTINSLAEEKKASCGGGATVTPKKTFGGMTKTPVRQAQPYGAYVNVTPTSKKNDHPASNTTAIEIPASENATYSANLLGHSYSLPENMTSNNITDSPKSPEIRNSCPPNLINSSEIEPQESQASDQHNQNSSSQEQTVNTIMETDHSTQRIDEMKNKQKQPHLTDVQPNDVKDNSILLKPRSTTNTTSTQQHGIFSSLLKLRESSTNLMAFLSSQPSNPPLPGGGATGTIQAGGAKVGNDDTSPDSAPNSSSRRVSAAEK
ncbi:MAG: hypothetical protein KBD37_01690 [Burkholderiales bacterium]|nr:hypothetical protein [Burkholderiales bacterium]